MAVKAGCGPVVGVSPTAVRDGVSTPNFTVSNLTGNTRKKFGLNGDGLINNRVGENAKVDLKALLIEPHQEAVNHQGIR